MKLSVPLLGVLSVLSVACGSSSIPVTVDLATLIETAKPAGAEKAVLLNFWATW